MRKIILITLSLVVISCHSQDKDVGENKPSKNKESQIKKEISINPNTMQTYTTEKFDINTYFKNRNEVVGSFEYTGNNGDNIIESDIGSYSFFKDVTPKNSFFTTHKEYYKDGALKTSWQSFINNGFIKGIRYEYDLKGKLIKVEDNDKPFKFTWEQVKKYIEQDLKLDFLKDEVIVYNYDGLSGGKPTWDINFKGNYKDVFGVYYVTLEGNTGELLKVKKNIGS